jgi:hypothetical protein
MMHFRKRELWDANRKAPAKAEAHESLLSILPEGQNYYATGFFLIGADFPAFGLDTCFGWNICSLFLTPLTRSFPVQSRKQRGE